MDLDKWSIVLILLGALLVGGTVVSPLFAGIGLALAALGILLAVVALLFHAQPTTGRDETRRGRVM